MVACECQAGEWCAGHGVQSSQAALLRPLTISNFTAEPLLLAHACIMPPRPHTFALLDNHGVAHRLLGQGRAVALSPGSIYSLTLALDTADGPWRE